MEDNAYELLITSAYVLVFITALSATIYMLSTISKYSDLAFNYGKNTTQTSLVTVTPDENLDEISPSKDSQIIVKGSELISYYFNYKNLDFYGADKPKSNYDITIEGVNDNNMNYSNLLKRIDVSAQYIMKIEEYNATTATYKVSLKKKV